jgi:hypothetical protein
MAQNTYAISEGVLGESLGNAARTTLNYIDAHINRAVKEANVLYENRNTNGVAYNAVSSSVVKDMLTSATASYYLKTLNITNSRNVQIQFVDSNMGGDDGTANKAQIFDRLASKRILLVPVLALMPTSIPAWECLTDADDEVISFAGQVETSVNTRSFIAAYSDNEFLGNCKYIAKTTMDDVWVQ